MAFDFHKPNSTPNRRNPLGLSSATTTGATGILVPNASLFQAPLITAVLTGLQSTTGLGGFQAIPNIVLLTGVSAVGHLSDDDAGGPITPGGPATVFLTGIRSLGATGYFGGVAPAGTPATKPASFLDIVALIKALQVPSGVCQGAFFNNSAKGGINWYNANVGLVSICQFLTAQELDVYIRPYLDAYVLQMASDGSISDISFNSGQTDLNAIGQVPQANDDSYGATFIRLAYRYTVASQNFAWFDTNRGALTNILENLIVNNRRADGMVSAFAGSRRNGAQDVGLLRNNCEDWAALNEFSILLTQRNDTFNAARYANAANSIASSIDAALWTATGALSPGFKNGDTDAALASTFNPNVVGHAYPQAMGVGTLSGRYAQSYAYINTNAPGWESLGYDPLPWLVLGLLAALRGDTSKANTQTGQFEALYTSAPQSVTVNELGMYQRTKSVLAGLPAA